MAIVNSPITIASVRNAPASAATRMFGRITRHERRPPARAEALRRLGQRVHVDRAEARVEREVDVREREDHVGADEETGPACRGTRTARAVVLEELEQADDEDDRRHDERHERQEADHGPQPRQLQVHPVERRHEEEQADHDRLEREAERELERRPELRVVEDEAVRGEAAALPRLRVLDAEEERREQRERK